MKVDSGNDTESGGSIIIYATGDGDEYEAELVEGKSHGGGKLLANERRASKTSRLKVVLEACASRRRKNQTLADASISVRPPSAVSVVASNKPMQEHDQAVSTNPFEDEVPFDESKHDKIGGTNPFDDDVLSTYPIARRTANPFDV
jgi:hypothetical protein